MLAVLALVGGLCHVAFRLGLSSGWHASDNDYLLGRLNTRAHVIEALLAGRTNEAMAVLNVDVPLSLTVLEAVAMGERPGTGAVPPEATQALEDLLADPEALLRAAARADPSDQHGTADRVMTAVTTLREELSR